MLKMEFAIARRVDARGLLCPLPTVKASLALDEIRAGEILELWADDPITKGDFTAWCSETGHSIVSLSEEPDSFKFHVRKG